MIGHAVLPIVEEYAPRFAKRIYWSPVLPSPVNGAVHRRIDDTLKDFGLCKSLTREIAEYVPQPKMTRPQYLLQGPSRFVTAQQFEEAVQAGSEQRLIGELSTLLTDRFGDKGSDVLENVNFERLNLSGIVLKNIKITGGKFFEADLSNAKLDTVNFIGCDMRGVNWSGVVTKNVIVKDCQLDSGHAVPKSLTLADPSPVIPKKTSCLTM